jgi:hypothetical protein
MKFPEIPPGKTPSGFPARLSGKGRKTHCGIMIEYEGRNNKILTKKNKLNF